MNATTQRILLTLTAALLTAGTIPTTRADYASELQGLQPLTYWRFNDNVQTPQYDIATNLGSLGPAGNGQYYDTVLRSVEGAIAGDNAVGFSNPTLGTAYFGSMRVPNNPALNPSGAFTIEFWAKPSNDTASLLSPVSSMSFVSGRAGYLFYQNAATWQLRIGVTGSTTASLVNGGTVLSNQWQHIVGVYSGGPSGTMTLFVDGVQVATGPASYEPNTDAPFYLGSTASPNRTFDGAVDEVAFYSAALSAGQIAAHHAARTSNPAGYATQVLADAPVGYWRVNEPVKAYPVALNSGVLGTAANGGYVGATNVAGPSGTGFPGLEPANASLACNGVFSYVEVPSLGLSGSMTIAAWVNPNIVTGDRAIAGENTSYAFKLSGAELRFTTPGILDHTSTAAGVVAGVWQHVAVIFTPGAVGGAQFFLNGQPVGTADASGVNAGTSIFWIGKNQWAGQDFDGAIDEVAVFDRALTAGNIMSLYYTAVGTQVAPVMISDPPVISPAGTIYTTTPFSITVDVAGSLPMYYQWRRNGTAITGATSAIYHQPSAGLADAGTYDVVITNAYGTVTSQGISVTIDPAVPPTIVTQPASRSVYEGGQASFTVTAAGTTPITYQWKHTGTNLPGATNATLVITDCSADDAGAYAVGLTNVAGGLVSATATLTFITPPADSYEEFVVANKPIGFWRLNETSGTTAVDVAGGHDGQVFSSVVMGTAGPASPAYLGLPANNTAYTFNGTDSGVQASSLGLPGPLSVAAWIKPNTLAGDKAIAGENGSWFFKLLDNELRFTTPGILDHNSSGASLVAGQWYHVAATFTPGAAEGAKFFVNGQLITAVTASSLTPGTSAFWIGTNQWVGQVFDGVIDDVVVYNTILSPAAISEMYGLAAFGSTTPPSVARAPVSATVMVGATATLSASIVGSLPLSYQWKKDGADVPGATQSVLTIANAAYADGGSYTLHASNGAGQITTAPAMVTVMPAPLFANLTNDLVLHLKFEDNFSDTSGRGHHGNTAYPPAFVPGKLGKAIECSTVTSVGTYTFVQVYDINTYQPLEDLQFSSNVNFSASFWVKFTGSPTDLPFICTAFNSYGNQGLTFAPGWQTGTWSYYLGAVAGTGTSLGSGYATQPVNDGNWHLLVHSFDRTGNAVTYLDGVQVDSRSMVGVGDLDTLNWLTIGQDPTTAYQESVTFQIDDIGIWRRALNSYEAASIYGAAQNSGQSFDVYGPVKIDVAKAGADLVIAWQAGTLLSAPSLNGPWTPVAGASAPTYKVTPGTTGNVFYRVRL